MMAGWVSVGSQDMDVVNGGIVLISEYGGCGIPSRDLEGIFGWRERVGFLWGEIEGYADLHVEDEDAAIRQHVGSSALSSGSP